MAIEAEKSFFKKKANRFALNHAKYSPGRGIGTAEVIAF
ncbi:hypothetical protein ABH907_003764 [Pseudomonas frederiksbergensis]